MPTQENKDYGVYLNVLVFFRMGSCHVLQQCVGIFQNVRSDSATMDILLISIVFFLN